MELIHLSTLTHCRSFSSQPPSPAAFPDSFCRRLPGHMTFAMLKVLFSRPTTDRASLATSLTLIGLLTPLLPGDSASSPEVTHCSSIPCRPQPPWCGGRMRAPSPYIRRLDLSHRWPTGSSLGFPIDYSPVLLRRPFGFPSRRTPCPPKYYKQWLQLRLGCIQLSPSGPFRHLHTFCFLRPARNYPRFWIWRPSFERQRVLNPPEQRAAQR